jgi:hypothetical protein
MAPPGSNRGARTAAIVWSLGEHGVFDGWERHTTNDGEKLSNRQRDQHMVTECAADKLVLITRDEEVIVEASTAGVDGCDPEAFAARHISREDAATTFQERLWDAVLGYVSVGPPGSEMRRFAAGRAARDDPEKVIENSAGTFGAERPRVAGRRTGVQMDRERGIVQNTKGTSTCTML